MPNTIDIHNAQDFIRCIENEELYLDEAQVIPDLDEVLTLD